MGRPPEGRDVMGSEVTAGAPRCLPRPLGLVDLEETRSFYMFCCSLYHTFPIDSVLMERKHKQGSLCMIAKEDSYWLRVSRDTSRPLAKGQLSKPMTAGRRLMALSL